MEQLINTLLSSVFSMYLPIPEVATRIAISIALSGIISKLLQMIFTWVELHLDITRLFRRSHSYVIINPDHEMYDKLLKHIYDKHINMLIGCKLESDLGKNKLTALKLKKSYIKETYLNQHVIWFSLDETHTNVDKSKNAPLQSESTIKIIVSSSSPLTIIESYINDFIRDTHNKISNKIPIYRIQSKSSKKGERNLRWQCSVVKLSKNIKNTIMSETVEKNLYLDVEKFVIGEQFYLEKGLPYKRGYILHGPPGCGKTSVIKAIANQYKLPIFIIDLSILKSNAEFTKIAFDISSHLADASKYMVVFEDIDRSSIFDRWNSAVTMDCFLNILDGIDEYYGRITVLTGNDIEKMSSTKALLRPGRIDTIVELSTCTMSQIEQIIRFYTGHFDPNTMKLDPNIIITPAQLIQLILILLDPHKIIAVLNRNKNFEKISYEKVLGIYHADSKIESELKSEIKNPDADDDSDSDDDLCGVARQIKQTKSKLSTIDFKIALNVNKLDTLSAPDRILHDRLVLNKRSTELRLDKLSKQFELEQHNIKSNNVQSKKRGRRRIS